LPNEMIKKQLLKYGCEFVSNDYIGGSREIRSQNIITYKCECGDARERGAPSRGK